MTTPYYNLFLFSMLLFVRTLYGNNLLETIERNDAMRAIDTHKPSMYRANSGMPAGDIIFTNSLFIL